MTDFNERGNGAVLFKQRGTDADVTGLRELFSYRQVIIITTTGLPLALSYRQVVIITITGLPLALTYRQLIIITITGLPLALSNRPFSMHYICKHIWGKRKDIR